MTNTISLLALMVAVAQVCLAFPGGAPKTACSSMTPIHMLFSAKSAQDAPFAITVDKTNVKSLKSSDVGKVSSAPTVTVTIKSTSDTEFKGYLLQAREDRASSSIGTFTISSDSEGKTMDCADGTSNAVTHKSRSKKSNQSFLWTPPLDFAGKVVFTATVVEGFRTFYTEVTSSPVTVTA